MWVSIVLTFVLIVVLENVSLLAVRFAVFESQHSQVSLLVKSTFLHSVIINMDVCWTQLNLKAVQFRDLPQYGNGSDILFP